MKLLRLPILIGLMGVAGLCLAEPTPDPVALKSARIAEAQADLEYHQERVKTSRVLLAKARTDVRFAYTDFKRIETLHIKKAVTRSELESSQLRLAQTQLNVQLMESRIKELEAEVRAAQARWDQEKASPLSVLQFSHCRDDDETLENIALGCFAARGTHSHHHNAHNKRLRSQ